jgi:tRNA pseudouridine55 synthase
LPVFGGGKHQFKVRALSDQDAIDLRHGKRLRVIDETEVEPIAAIDSNGKLIAMLTKSGNAAKSLVVFADGSDGGED